MALIPVNYSIARPNQLNSRLSAIPSLIPFKMRKLLHALVNPGARPPAILAPGSPRNGCRTSMNERLDEERAQAFVNPRPRHPGGTSPG
jgi:hypothetical protein